MVLDTTVTQETSPTTRTTTKVPTVDAHLHLWQSDPNYPDQTSTTLSPTADVPPALLEGYMDEYGIDRAVIVQPVYPGEDNQFVVRCARHSPRRFSVVCVVDPGKPDACRRLKLWVDHNNCRGLRLRPGVPAEEKWFGDSSTFPIWEFAEKANVVISVLGRFRHLPTIDRLATTFPTVSPLVDHLAHPPSTRPSDCEELLALARHENVYLKVSGFPYYSRQAYPYTDCRRLVKAIYERFGAGRMIWGSDFPHILLQAGYGRTVKWLGRTCSYMSAEEMDLVMGGNALRLYW